MRQLPRGYKFVVCARTCVRIFGEYSRYLEADNQLIIISLSSFCWLNKLLLFEGRVAKSAEWVFD